MPSHFTFHICDISRQIDLPPKKPGAIRALLFSDIHLGLFPAKISQLMNKRILGSFNHMLRRKHKLQAGNIAKLLELFPVMKPDIAICPGDITSVALPEEFALATAAILPIRDALDGNFIYVPGNHDAYVDEPESKAALAKAFDTLNSSRWQLGLLPATFDFGFLSLLLINAALPLGPLFSCGVIGQENQNAISAILNKPAAAMAAICHFPAIARTGENVGWRHGLRGAGFLREQLDNNRISCILSGHEHHPYSYTLENGSAQICAGSLTLRNSFAIIDFT